MYEICQTEAACCLELVFDPQFWLSLLLCFGYSETCKNRCYTVTVNRFVLTFYLVCVVASGQGLICDIYCCTTSFTFFTSCCFSRIVNGAIFSMCLWKTLKTSALTYICVCVIISEDSLGYPVAQEPPGVWTFAKLSAKDSFFQINFVQSH